MNQTYRRLYILIRNIGIPQEVHMENLRFFCLLFVDSVCICLSFYFLSVLLRSKFTCMRVCSGPILSLSRTYVSRTSWSGGKRWSDRNKCIYILVTHTHLRHVEYSTYTYRQDQHSRTCTCTQTNTPPVEFQQIEQGLLDNTKKKNRIKIHTENYDTCVLDFQILMHRSVWQLTIILRVRHL